MSEDQSDRTQPMGSDQGTRQSRPGNADIPRRGYERQRDPTGTLRPTGRPALPPEEPQAYQPPPPRYGARPGAPPPPYRGRKRAPRDSGLYLPWWSLVILIVFVGGVAFGLLYLAAEFGGSILVDQTPQIIVVTGQVTPDTPSNTNAGPPTAIATFQPSPVPNITTAEPSRTPLPGGCLLNEEVVVFGTGGVGLNLRTEPGGDVAFIAKEGERMLVIDGPQFFDDITWCQVRSTQQSSSFGWAALDFLLPADAIDSDDE